MSNRVYLLLDVAEAKANQVAEKLEGMDSIRIVDVLEGQPGVIAMVEASERLILAKTAMRVIASVENMIDDLRILPARDGKPNCLSAFIA